MIEECPILVVDKHPEAGATLVQGVIKQKWIEGYDLVTVQRHFIVFRRMEPVTKQAPKKATKTKDK